MTPAEKAKELVDKYIDQMIESDAYFVKSGAKHCALIAVDESVNTFISIHHKLTEIDMLNGDVKETATYQYFKEVKQEIEKL